jgi:tungstate transport system substrate-binding protein
MIAKISHQLFIFFLVLLSLPGASALAESRIRCASTTSTQNSGLFDYILPVFERKTGIKVDIIAVGTGAAFEIGKRGDADMVIVHAKAEEIRLVKEGYFIERHDLMYNDFIITGPNSDPAGIAGLKDVVEVFRTIAKGRFYFVSRGDESGTHKKEMSIWEKVGVNPSGQKWYLEVGQGMAKTLRIANEKRAYSITDRATWLATGDRMKFQMNIVSEGDPLLYNQYGVMIVNPKKHVHVKYREAKEFEEWLISGDGQDLIGSFRDNKGNRLFSPNAK